MLVSTKRQKIYTVDTFRQVRILVCKTQFLPNPEDPRPGNGCLCNLGCEHHVVCDAITCSLFLAMMAIRVSVPPNAYQPVIARRLIRKFVAWSGSWPNRTRIAAFSTYNAANHSYSETTPTQVPPKQDIRRPYTFHIGASWAAKPDDSFTLRSPSPYPSETAIGSWRDRMLTRKFAGSSMSSRRGDPGEDFFFVQQVSCIFCYVNLTISTRTLTGCLHFLNTDAQRVSEYADCTTR